MCTVLLALGVNPIAVNKYIISCHIRYIKDKILRKSYEPVMQKGFGVTESNRTEGIIRFVIPVVFIIKLDWSV